eukprot:m.253469 g.253469  ORF g.253469 m.253469 type:complete len:394 (-) comp18389_c0_seq1:223-1404(-)
MNSETKKVESSTHHRTIRCDKMRTTCSSQPPPPTLPALCVARPLASHVCHIFDIVHACRPALCDLPLSQRRGIVNVILGIESAGTSRFINSMCSFGKTVTMKDLKEGPLLVRELRRNARTDTDSMGFCYQGHTFLAVHLPNLLDDPEQIAKDIDHFQFALALGPTTLTILYNTWLPYERQRNLFLAFPRLFPSVPTALVIAFPPSADLDVTKADLLNMADLPKDLRDAIKPFEDARLFVTSIDDAVLDGLSREDHRAEGRGQMLLMSAKDAQDGMAGRSEVPPTISAMARAFLATIPHDLSTEELDAITAATQARDASRDVSKFTVVCPIIPAIGPLAPALFRGIRVDASSEHQGAPAALCRHVFHVRHPLAVVSGIAVPCPHCSAYVTLVGL